MKDKIQSPVCLLMGILCALIFIESRSGDKYLEYRALLGESLTEALWRELTVRDTNNVVFSASVNAEDEVLADTVKGYIQTAEKKGFYAAPRWKYLYNVGENNFIRNVHSFCMQDIPIVADSLYNRWRQVVVRKSDNGFSSAALRLRLPGKGGTVCLPDSLTLMHADSICVRYAGYYCELEAAVFSTVGRHELLGWRDWLFAVVYGGIGYLMCAGLWRLYRVVRRRKAGWKVSRESGPTVGVIAPLELEHKATLVHLGAGTLNPVDRFVHGPAGKEKLSKRDTIIVEKGETEAMRERAV